MYLPLLIGLLIALAAAPAFTPLPADIPLLLTEPIGFLLLVAMVGFFAWRRICHHCEIGDEAQSLQRRSDAYGKLLGPIIIGGFALLIIVGHWAELAAMVVSPEIWSLYRLLLILPLLLAFCIRWTASYLSRRCLVNLANYRHGLEALPPAARSVRDYASYMAFHLRLNVLTLILPFFFILLIHDLAFLALGMQEDAFNFQLVLFGSILIIYLASPLLLRFAWKTRRMVNADDPLGRRLRAVARRTGVRVSGTFRWDTAGLMGNACLTGFGLPWRYVFISDLLLEHLLPPQLEAVYGHELGHARHHHLPVFLLAAVIVVLVFFLLEQFLLVLLLPVWLATGVQILLVLIYWTLLLAVLSPFLERQSDLLGAASVQCPGHRDPYACPVHKPAASRDEKAAAEQVDLSHICPFQGWAFASAMERLAEINGMSLDRRNMRHFSLRRRIDYVLSVTDQPDVVAAYHGRMRLLKLLMLLLALVLAALAFILPPILQSI